MSRVSPGAVRASAAPTVDGAALDPENGEAVTLMKTASVGKTIAGAWIGTADQPPTIPRPRPEDDPHLSPEQRACLAHVQALTTEDALELLSLYQAIKHPEHRASVRKLARILAEISRQHGEENK